MVLPHVYGKRHEWKRDAFVISDETSATPLILPFANLMEEKAAPWGAPLLLSPNANLPNSLRLLLQAQTKLLGRGGAGATSMRRLLYRGHFRRSAGRSTKWARP